MTRRNKASIEPRHDFTVIARGVIEGTIGHRLMAPPPNVRVESLSTLRKSAGGLFDADDHPGVSRSFPQTIVQAVVRAIARRMNIRSTVRLTGVPQHLVKAIVVRVGEACAQYHQKRVSDIRFGALQCSLKMVLQEKTAGPCSTGGIWSRWDPRGRGHRLIPRPDSFRRGSSHPATWK